MKVPKLKIYIQCFLLVLLSLEAYSKTYYISSSEGKNSNKGTSISKPWESLKKVSRKNFKPGDSILFKRGDVWRGQLIPKSSGSNGNYIYYGAYGEGDKPLFLGSASTGSFSDWKFQENNIWKTKVKKSKDVGNIILNSAADLVTKKASIDELVNNNDFYSKKNKLYYRYTKNPLSEYRSIELAITKHIIFLFDVDYLILENLAVKYGGGHGFYCQRTSNVNIKSCDISYIGGGFLRPNERFGNGIEFWEETENCTVENCRIDQIYDSGLTNQGKATNSVQQNITYQGNIISNCGLASFEYFNRSPLSKTNNIKFENNISIDAGYGWAPEREGNYGGYHILFGRNSGTTDNFSIKNNEFHVAKRAAIIFFKDKTWNGFEKLQMENNKYNETDKEKFLYRMFTDGQGWENFKYKETENYLRTIKKDRSSRFR